MTTLQESEATAQLSATAQAGLPATLLPGLAGKAELLAQRGPPEQVYGGLLRAYGLLQRVMRPYFLQFGLTASQWSILRILYRAEEEGRTDGLRLVELGQRLLVQPPSVTTLVRRLEKAGLVIHVAAPTDRRGVQLRLAEPGRELVRRILAVHKEQIRRILGGLSDLELTHFVELLERLTTHLAAAAAQTPEPTN
jgi:DNA-binding MarR family transcriptional regulator